MAFKCFICNGNHSRALLRIPPSFFAGEGSNLSASGLYQDYCLDCGALVNVAHNLVSPEFYEAQYKKRFQRSNDFIPTQKSHEEKAKRNCAFIVQEIGHPGILLEVGAHMGCLMNALQKEGWEVRGIEPSPSLCQIGKELYSLEIRQGFYDKEGYKAEQFDLIIFDNVLEHPEEPLELLKTAHYHLKPGGSIFFILPVLETIQMNQIGGWHLTILSKNNWKHIIEQCGFTIKNLALDGLGGGDSARLRCLAQKSGSWPETIDFSPQQTNYILALLKLTRIVAVHKLRRFFR